MFHNNRAIIILRIKVGISKGIGQIDRVIEIIEDLSRVLGG